MTITTRDIQKLRQKQIDPALYFQEKLSYNQVQQGLMLVLEELADEFLERI